MIEYYNQEYSKEEIGVILDKVKDCVNDGSYTISYGQNRQKNEQFIREYNLNRQRQQEILLGIEVLDFCHSLNNTKPGFEYEILYVFCPQKRLFSITGEEEQVDIYIKFNTISTQDGDRVIAISFHKREKPIEYAFR